MAITKEKMLARLQQGKLLTVDDPLEEARKWEERQLAAAEKYGSRPDFKYDLQSDPLYQQYREQAMRAGRLSMMDTMGQARANNGGYGTSYSQMAGQQAYNSQLQTLNDKIPDLYTAAWNRYQNVGEDLLKRYQVAGQMKELLGQGALGSAGGGGGGGGYSSGGSGSGSSTTAKISGVIGLGRGPISLDKLTDLVAAGDVKAEKRKDGVIKVTNVKSPQESTKKTSGIATPMFGNTNPLELLTKKFKK